MKFRWEEKEKYFRMVEKELRDAGIDFMKVDRTQFGVQVWKTDFYAFQTGLPELIR